MILQCMMNVLFIKLTHTLWLEIQDIEAYLSNDHNDKQTDSSTTHVTA